MTSLLHRQVLKEQVEVLKATKQAWNDVSPDWIAQTWAEQIPTLASKVASAQVNIATAALLSSSEEMVQQATWAAPSSFLNPEGFRYAAADGRSLEGLLEVPSFTARQLVREGRPPVMSLEAAGQQLTMLLVSNLASIGRSASSVMTTERIGAGYIRLVHGDACDRCQILAGKFYRWNEGFLRHPRCQCEHVSAHMSAAEAERRGMFEDPYEAFNSLSEAEQDARYGPANAKAIRDGADIFQVVNSKRGMTPNGLFTLEGTSKRGYAKGVLRPGQRRATPELIYKWANGSRSEAQRLLKEHGYVLSGGQNPMGSILGQREGFGALGRGGTRKAASQAVLDARATGVRDPRNRYTMTEAERRLYDAERDWQMVLKGQNPYSSRGFGNTPNPRGLGLNTIGAVTTPLTPKIAAIVEEHYLQMLVTGGEKYVKEQAITRLTK